MCQAFWGVPLKTGTSGSAESLLETFDFQDLYKPSWTDYQFVILIGVVGTEAEYIFVVVGGLVGLKSSAVAQWYLPSCLNFNPSLKESTICIFHHVESSGFYYPFNASLNFWLANAYLLGLISLEEIQLFSFQAPPYTHAGDSEKNGFCFTEAFKGVSPCMFL